MIYLWISVALLVIIIVSIFTFVIYTKQKTKKRKMDIVKLFKKSCELKKIENYTLDFVKKNTHDFYFEDEHVQMYIKIIYNFSNQEICINNAIKWQLRRKGSDDSLNYVEGIEPLMRLDFEGSSKKQKKLFIVYPGARAILKVINECEMIFVYPDTDVYGARIVSYTELLANPSLIEI